MRQSLPDDECDQCSTFYLGYHFPINKREQRCASIECCIDGSDGKVFAPQCHPQVLAVSYSSACRKAYFDEERKSRANSRESTMYLSLFLTSYRNAHCCLDELPTSSLFREL